VDLVESGKFLTNKNFCKKVIKKVLDDVLTKNSIDTVTLSSTHLPFLKIILENEFNNIQFIDPANIVAKKIFKKIKNNQSKNNSLKFFTSGDPKILQKNLTKLKIKNKVYSLTI